MVIYCGPNELAAEFARFLNAHWPTECPVTLYVADDDFQAVEADGQRGFGAYCRDGDDARIVVISPAAWAEVLRENGETPEGAEREFLITIAHEYAHHLQADSGALSQEDADEFAEKAVEAFYALRTGGAKGAEVPEEAGSG